jgi:hypothetical protein
MKSYKFTCVICDRHKENTTDILPDDWMEFVAFNQSGRKVLGPEIVCDICSYQTDYEAPPIRVKNLLQKFLFRFFVSN